MKKIYIKCIKELSYDFSLEEIEQIYQLVQWRWHKSPIVEKNIKKRVGGKAMSDNKKYYYLKLKDNFFESDELVLLENQQDGYIYSNILLKLYLRSLKNNGKLMFKDRIPYNVRILSSVVRQPEAVVEKALYLFKELGLIEILDNGAIYMLDIQNFIGKSSTEADRIRKYRNKIDEDKKLLDNDVVQMYDKSTPEIEIEKEIEINKKIVPNKNVEEPTPIKLLLKNGEEYTVDDQKIKEWISIYSGIDVMQELRIMAEWCKNNPKKRKTESGIVRFIINWLNREKDRKRKGSTKEDWSFFDD